MRNLHDIPREQVPTRWRGNYAEFIDYRAFSHNSEVYTTTTTGPVFIGNVVEWAITPTENVLWSNNDAIHFILEYNEI